MNRWTAGMLFLVAVLYSFLAFMGVFTKEACQSAEEVQGSSSPALTMSELKQKEALVRERLEADPRLAISLTLFLMAIFVAGFVLDILWLNGVAAGRRWVPDPFLAVTPGWGFRELWIAVIFLFFSEGCLFIAQVIGYWSTGLELSQDLTLLVNSLVRDLAVAALVVFLLRRYSTGVFSQLGLHARGFWRQVGYGVTAYVAMIPVMALTFLIIAQVLRLFAHEPLPQNVVQMYLKTESQPYLLWFTLFVAALGPVLEEMFFRGFAYPVLRTKFGIAGASALTAAVFAGIHLNAVAFVPIFILGYFLSYLYQTTGSLIPSITAHIVHNTLMVTMTLGFRYLAS